MSDVFAVIVSFVVKPDYRSRFMASLRENAQASIALEPACMRFDIVEPIQPPAEVWLYELYADRDSFEQQHLRAPHFVRFDTATRDMIVSKTVTAGTVLETQKA